MVCKWGSGHMVPENSTLKLVYFGPLMTALQFPVVSQYMYVRYTLRRKGVILHL